MIVLRTHNFSSSKKSTGEKIKETAIVGAGALAGASVPALLINGELAKDAEREMTKLKIRADRGDKEAAKKYGQALKDSTKFNLKDKFNKVSKNPKQLKKLGKGALIGASIPIAILGGKEIYDKINKKKNN